MVQLEEHRPNTTYIPLTNFLPFPDFPILARSSVAIDRRVRLFLRRDRARSEFQACAEDSTRTRVACAQTARRASKLRAPPGALSRRRRSSRKHAPSACPPKAERP